jgi:FOG: WD40 repeat
MGMNRKAQAYNPFLPIDVYIPDGEPHVFGDRIYLYGSHDKEGGETFCMLDYVVYSAPVTDLTDWREEGIIYQATQDPDYHERNYMYAPDVVRGNDGRYYLYYCMSGPFGHGGYFGPIQVAVCDTPAGKYEYLGYVRDKNGQPAQDFVCFDPGVFNDNGRIFLYSGTQYGYEEESDFFENEKYIQEEMKMFNRSREEILEKAKQGSVMGPIVMELEEDMLTLKKPAKHLIPYAVKGTSFEEHPFFEASSMRKVGDKYYFIYSSMQNHELCYATSDYPDRDFIFGGTIVSNGDVGINGRTLENKLNMTGTTHGSIEYINGEWYVFYHRLTHKSDYSRQACAQKIKIEEDGSIRQVEITSCGLNGGPLAAEGSYPATICCNLTNGHMPHGCNKIYDCSIPNVSHQGEERFISEVSDGTMIGYKYFEIRDNKKLKILYRGNANGTLAVAFEPDGDARGEFEIRSSSKWAEISADVSFENGITAIYLKYSGVGMFDIREISF